jgi:hypothetical protein
MNYSLLFMINQKFKDLTYYPELASRQLTQVNNIEKDKYFNSFVVR